MPAMVSPYCTVWRWPGSCLPPLLGAAGVPAAPEPVPVRCRDRPTTMRLGLAIPLALASAETVVPYRAAMLARVSPLRTVWDPLDVDAALPPPGIFSVDP